VILNKVKDYMVDSSILTSSHMKKFLDADKDGVFEFERFLHDKNFTTLVFDVGFVTFRIKGDECFIAAYFRDKSSKMSKDDIWEGFQGMLKDNGCKKIVMYTSISPSMWESRYGFKINRYEMEKIL
jgi:hypothetical protein